MQQMGVAARNASRALAVASTATKSNALVTIAEKLDTERENIKAANAADLAKLKTTMLTSHSWIDCCLGTRVSIK